MKVTIIRDARPAMNQWAQADIPAKGAVIEIDGIKWTSEATESAGHCVSICNQANKIKSILESHELRTA